MIFDNDNDIWYIAGLHFECYACGNCCSGPDEGYIWFEEEEAKMMAEKLGMSVQDFKSEHTRRINRNERSINEDPDTKDCVFLCDMKGIRGCKVYECRPNQCRTWPFWDVNLMCPETWNIAAERCPGINKGRLYTYEEIEKQRNQKKWW